MKRAIMFLGLASICLFTAKAQRAETGYWPDDGRYYYAYGEKIPLEISDNKLLVSFSPEFTSPVTAILEAYAQEIEWKTAWNHYRSFVKY